MYIKYTLISNMNQYCSLRHFCDGNIDYFEMKHFQGPLKKSLKC